MIANFVRSLIPKRFRPIGYLEHLAEAHTGRCVAQGPFVGMHYIVGSVGSAYIPKLLGIYERELIGCVEHACAQHFPLIVDIGAAEGYYAVGLARRNPQARVIAFEMEEKGRSALREMAALNGIQVIEPRSVVGSQKSDQVSVVEARLEVHGRCEFENLQATLASAERSLVVCDVEGYEEFLLVPEKIPSLARATLLVEMHDFCCPGITERITSRFTPTHFIKRIWQEPRARKDFPITALGLRLLPSRYVDWAVSEWRPERMSWLWMEPKQ